MLIVLLSFIESLATKCVSLNNESCFVALTVTDLNPNGLCYYPILLVKIDVKESVILLMIRLVEFAYIMLTWKVLLMTE